MHIERFNPWNTIFEAGTPSDLVKPYEGFEYIVNELHQVQARTILDVACGSGRHAVELVKQGFDVYGFDLSDFGIEQVKELLVNEVPADHFSIADMFDTYPYTDNFFDGAIAIQAIYHGYKKNMAAALSEISRVLKPRGLLAFTVSLNKERSNMGADQPELQQIDEHTFLPLKGREKGLVHFYPTQEELVQMLEMNFDHVMIIEDTKNGYYLVQCYKKDLPA